MTDRRVCVICHGSFDEEHILTCKKCRACLCGKCVEIYNFMGDPHCDECLHEAMQEEMCDDDEDL